MGLKTCGGDVFVKSTTSCFNFQWLNAEIGCGMDGYGYPTFLRVNGMRWKMGKYGRG